jgi:hypothetical protein
VPAPAKAVLLLFPITSQVRRPCHHGHAMLTPSPPRDAHAIAAIAAIAATASRFPTARQTEAARKAEAAAGAPPLPSGDQKLYHVKQVCQFPCLRRKDAR